MRLIEGISDQPKQNFSFTLEDGSTVSMRLEYRPAQLGWFYDVSWSDTFLAKGRRLVASQNILRQFKGFLPFGLVCLTKQGKEPFNQRDFSRGNAQLYVIEGVELDELDEAVGL